VSEVHHRLDREDHAGAELLTRAALSVVLHLRRLVEFRADAVTDEVADDAAALTFDVLLNRSADVAHEAAVFDLGDADLERLAARLDDVTRLLAGRADVERGRRVAVPAILRGIDRGHIDVDDVAVLQPVRSRDAVTDHFVDGRADALREAF